MNPKTARRFLARNAWKLAQPNPKPSLVRRAAKAWNRIRLGILQKGERIETPNITRILRSLILRQNSSTLKETKK